MKKIFLTILIIISPTVFAQTQTEMNLDAAKKFDKVDKELNTVYKKILKKYSSDTLFIGKLKISQNYWIKFRDAEVEARFPAENKQVEYGTIYTICINAFAERKKQKKELKN
ncbi:lysozyme inhibitor LprI family protein [Halpernia sp. GG3]